MLRSHSIVVACGEHDICLSCSAIAQDNIECMHDTVWPVSACAVSNTAYCA